MRQRREAEASTLGRIFQKKRSWQRTALSGNHNTELQLGFAAAVEVQGGLTRAPFLSFSFDGDCIYFDVYGWLFLLKNNLSQASSLVRQFGTETSHGLSRHSKTSAGDAPHSRTLLPRA